MDGVPGGMPGLRTCTLLFLKPTLIAVASCRCWTNGFVFSLLHEPPYTEPYVRWCGRTAEVTPPPTRSGREAQREVGVSEPRAVATGSYTSRLDRIIRVGLIRLR